MFNGDRTLRGKNELSRYTKEQIEEYVRCSEDIIFFAEKYFYILTLDHGKIKIPLWDFQKKILKVLVNVPDEKRNVVICASRQIGKTTVNTIYCLWRMLFFKEYKICILANKERTAIEILERIKLAFSLIPKWMQVGVTEWNDTSISFENLNCIEAYSTSSSTSRGSFYHDVILDEYAFVPINIQQKLTSSVIPTISSSKKAKIIMLSTPNGMEQFYNTFTDGVRGTNNYFPIKVLWSEVPGRDEAWKKAMIASLPGKELQFSQEFDCKFFGAANTLIDNNVLETIKPISPCELKWGGLVQIYEAPIAGKKYIIGVDPSGGTGKNYSVIQVLKVNKLKSLEQVALFRSNTHSPYDLGKFVIDLSEYYNRCLCLLENNSDVGGILCSQLFYQHEFDRLIFVDNKIGIRSTRQSKAEGNYLLKRYVEHGWLKINDRTTLYELSLYKEQSIGLFAADNNMNDDCVTSMMWAIYALLLQEVSLEYFDEEGNAIETTDYGHSEGVVALFD